MKLSAWLLAGSAALLAGGCGVKGPLYLPEKSTTVITTPAAAPAESSAPQTPAPPQSNEPTSPSAPVAPQSAPIPPTPASSDKDQDSQRRH
jgi:predicted small lipoprotein YifL